ncbi:MAG: hypothetical protein ACRCTQ_05795 [Brevinemataceae bacterium]
MIHNIPKNIILFSVFFISQCRVYDSNTNLGNLLSLEKEASKSWTPITTSGFPIDNSLNFQILDSGNNNINLLFKSPNTQNFHLVSYHLENQSWKFRLFNYILSDDLEVRNWYAQFFDSQNLVVLSETKSAGSSINIKLFKELNGGSSTQILKSNSYNTSIKSYCLNYIIPPNNSFPVLAGSTLNNPTEITAFEAYNNSSSKILKSFTPNPISDFMITKYNNTTYVIYVQNVSSKKILYDMSANKEIIIDNLPASVPASVQFFRDSNHSNIIWITEQSSADNFCVKQLNLDDHSITTKTHFSGYNSIIYANSKGRYYIAYITRDNSVEVIGTDDFNTFKTMGVSYPLNKTTDKFDFKIINDQLILATLINNNLQVFVHNRPNITPKDLQTFPVSAKINAPDDSKNLSISKLYKFDGSASTGGILSYFWSVDTPDEVIINNNTSATPSIKFTTKNKTYSITLKVNNGKFQNSTTIQIKTKP